MNTPQTIESGAGLLKTAYDSGDTLDLALKKRREKIMVSKGMKDAPEVEVEPATK
jgi:hypothetical protein